jgi:hypothetical protein
VNPGCKIASWGFQLHTRATPRCATMIVQRQVLVRAETEQQTSGSVETEKFMKV